MSESNDEQKEAEKIEQEEAESRASPSGKIVYKAILKEGEDELERSSSALFWSGLAAGLSMAFSLITQGLLQARLPESHWQPLVVKFGYSIGFLIVVLGRQQLFTENTLTPILPLLTHRNLATLWNVLRMWGVVLLANLIGALAIAWVIAGTDTFPDDVKESFVRIGKEAMEGSFGTTVWRAVFAGWLIALMVWLLPFAETGRFWVILVITYVVGLGHFAHIIVGSIEVFTVAAMGEASWGHVCLDFVLPALIGNILGGVTLVAALNHAQVVSGRQGEDL